MNYNDSKFDKIFLTICLFLVPVIIAIALVL